MCAGGSKTAFTSGSHILPFFFLPGIGDFFLPFLPLYPFPTGIGVLLSDKGCT